MKKTEKGMSKVIYVIIVAIAFSIIAYFTYDYIQEHNFKDYTKSVLKQNVTEFSKDKEIKYSEDRSYKIYSSEYNDAMVSKKIKVSKNKSYKVTCMVKTENVVSESENSGSGAQLSLEGTTTRSMAVTGTTDWQEIEMIFNSKNEEEVNIGVRLGGYLGNCKGTAWFSDIKVEEGVPDDTNSWKFACFIYNTTDVTMNGKEVKLQVTDTDMRDIKETITRFKDACSALSERKMTAECDIYNIESPLTHLSYDEEFGYYVAPEDVEKDIKATIDENNYDHIFIVVRLGNDEHKDDIEVNDWIGLGSMDYYGVGFSNIRLPNDSRSYVYRYNTRINLFPEEVLLHEFLHSLERNAKEYGYEIPALHDYEQYGYKNEKLLGEKSWYTDYMNCNITSNGTKIGLPPEIYTLKPAKKSDFEFSYEIKNAF